MHYVILLKCWETYSNKITRLIYTLCILLNLHITFPHRLLLTHYKIPVSNRLCHVISNRAREITILYLPFTSSEETVELGQNPDKIPRKVESTPNYHQTFRIPYLPARPTSSDIILLKYIPRRDGASDYQTIREHWDIIKIHSLPITTKAISKIWKIGASYYQTTVTPLYY